jgi:hypothetical protein
MTDEQERAWAGIEPEMTAEQEAHFAGVPPPSPRPAPTRRRWSLPRPQVARRRRPRSGARRSSGLSPPSDGPGRCSDEVPLARASGRRGVERAA